MGLLFGESRIEGSHIWDVLQSQSHSAERYIEMEVESY